MYAWKSVLPVDINTAQKDLDALLVDFSKAENPSQTKSSTKLSKQHLMLPRLTLWKHYKDKRNSN